MKPINLDLLLDRMTCLEQAAFSGFEDFMRDIIAGWLKGFDFSARMVATETPRCLLALGVMVVRRRSEIKPGNVLPWCRAQTHNLVVLYWREADASAASPIALAAQVRVSVRRVYVRLSRAYPAPPVSKRPSATLPLHWTSAHQPIRFASKISNAGTYGLMSNSGVLSRMSRPSTWRTRPLMASKWAGPAHALRVRQVDLASGKTSQRIRRIQLTAWPADYLTRSGPGPLENWSFSPRHLECQECGEQDMLGRIQAGLHGQSHCLGSVEPIHEQELLEPVQVPQPIRIRQQIRRKVISSVTTLVTTPALLAIGRFCKYLIIWRVRQDLNLQPSDPKSEALSN